MAQTARMAARAILGQGRAWVWAADGLGLALVVALVATAAGSPALAHAFTWLIVALPLGGCIAVIASQRSAVPAPVAARVVARCTITITPRPDAARS